MVHVYAGQGQLALVQVFIVHKRPVGDGFYKRVIRRGSQYALALMPVLQRAALGLCAGLRFLRHRHGDLRQLRAIRESIAAHVRREYIGACRVVVIGRVAIPGHGDVFL